MMTRELDTELVFKEQKKLEVKKQEKIALCPYVFNAEGS